MTHTDDTIAAISTPAGSGAIAIIRLSGKDAVSIADKAWKTQNNKSLMHQPANTIVYGSCMDGTAIIDDVVVSVFRKPRSYTGEDIVEIACHGSTYIQQQILHLMLNKGARLAEPGEFTLRAFLNGKMDLSQAEAVADLIAAEAKSTHKIAMKQMRGGFSSEIQNLRSKLLKIISLLELELDFSEEDVEFADRKELSGLLDEIKNLAQKLVRSFEYGNAIKKGVPVVIAGKTNTGKSTLLNALFKEEIAIVSDIAGTTRDSIEQTLNIDGILFRFIDTAGLRNTTDSIEKTGIERTQEKISKAKIIIQLADATASLNEIQQQLNSIQLLDYQQRIIALNKEDLTSQSAVHSVKNEVETRYPSSHVIAISAKNQQHVEELVYVLKKIFQQNAPGESDVVVNNARHYESLNGAKTAIDKAKTALKTGLSNDLVAFEVREVLHYLGLITGEIHDNEILEDIFKNFCIGK